MLSSSLDLFFAVACQLKSRWDAFNGDIRILFELRSFMRADARSTHSVTTTDTLSMRILPSSSRTFRFGHRT